VRATLSGVTSSVNLLELPNVRTEQELSKAYCAGRAYHHCIDWIERELPRELFTFDERTKPEKWLQAITKYVAVTGQAPIGPAAKQLFRSVEEARAEFRQVQDHAWGNRKIGPHTPADYERREARAWERFNAAKQQCLAAYKEAIRTGCVKRRRQKAARFCPGCNQEPLLLGQRKCWSCKAAARRNRNRRYRSKGRRETLSHLAINERKAPIPQNQPQR
jgi:hypothetical protein